MEKKLSEFNEKKYFDEEIAPLLTQLRQVCNRKKLPMYVCVTKSLENGKCDYYTDVLSPGAMDRELPDNRFAEYININQGIKDVTEEPLEELDFK